MAIKSFLETLKARPLGSSLLRFVTGNQSADMDSVVCAISYAYFHHQKYPEKPPFLPLVNITREEFRLRKDIVLLLQKHGISSSLLYFLDDVRGATEAAASASLDVVLVDHCNLQGELLTELFEQKRLTVSGIIDHHADEGVFTDASPRIIHSNGSCSALVFNYWNELGASLDADAASLLLGPLLVDTSDMQSKVEAGDTAAFVQYKQVLERDVSFISSLSSFYGELKSAKKDLDGFSLFDILRKDYKQFKFVTKSGAAVAVGFSSIGKPLSWILKKFAVSEVLHSLEQMSETFHLDVVLITSSFTQKDTKIYTREFCFSTKKAELEGLASAAASLQLSAPFYKEKSVSEALAQINSAVFFKVYNQGDTAASRKQVVPVVKAAIETEL